MTFKYYIRRKVKIKVKIWVIKFLKQSKEAIIKKRKVDCDEMVVKRELLTDLKENYLIQFNKKWCSLIKGIDIRTGK